jgi:hypothetical protein
MRPQYLIAETTERFRETMREPEKPYDPTKPNVARIYDFLLGGKDNFDADRKDTVRGFLGDLELMDPGLTEARYWKTIGGGNDTEEQLGQVWVAVGKKVTTLDFRA